jgi:hypothetical protein
MNSAKSTWTVARIAALLAGAAAISLAPQALAGAPRYTDLLLSDTKGGTAKQVFTPTTPKIFLSSKLADVPTGAKLTGTWIAAKTKVAPPNYRIDSVDLTVGPLMNQADFSMTKPNAGWPAGDYRVDLYINGKLASTVRFKVAP